MRPSIHELLSVNDWGTALQSGWQIQGEPGQWEIKDGRLRIDVAQGGADSGLELSLPVELDLRQPFVLEIELRFLSIGLADNSTEQDTKLILEVGAGDGQPGMQILLVGDRYKLDVDRSYLQYLIFRSELGERYRWRFEVRDQQVAMLRNGTYYGLHRLQGPRPAGLRLKIFGTPQVPASVEIGEITLEPLPSRFSLTKTGPKLVDAIAPAEWPMFRRDRANSAHSRLTGGWKDTPPRIAWSYPLGGWDSDALAWDIDRDGQDELLVVFEGSLSAFRIDGQRLWQRNIDAPRIFEIVDLDEDGRLEIVMSAGSPGHIEVLDAVNGQTRYLCHYDPEYPVRGLRIGKLDPDRDGLQIVVWSQSQVGYCLAFDQGLENGRVIWTFDYTHFNFTPEVVLADMDGDGLLEVVLATYSSFYVYDGRTGRVKMSLEAPLGRNYGLLVVKDIDGDGYPDIIMLAESLREHITVVHNNGGRSLSLLYDTFYEQNYPLDQRELRTLPGSVQDWDGDGRVEILYGLYDETDGDCWRTLLIDAVSGEVKASLDNLYLLSLDWLPGESPAALLTEISGRGRLQLVLHGDMSHMELEIEGPVHLVRFCEDGPQFLGELPSKEILLDYSWQNFPLEEWAIFMQKRHPLRLPGERGLYLVEKLQPESQDRVLRRYLADADGRLHPDGCWALPQSLPAGRVAGLCRLPGDASTGVLYTASDTQLYLLGRAGEILAVFPGGSMTGAPIVAQLEPEGSPSVLVCSAIGQLFCLDAAQEGQGPDLKWSAPASWNGHSLYGRQGQAVPVAFDWDQDGRKEILVGQPERRLSILSASGQVLWTTELPEEATFFNYGNFTGGSRFDVFAAFSNGAYGGGCGVYSPGREQPVWQSDGGAYTTAIMDLDGDGCDDIVTRDLFWRRSLDGESGRDIFPITQWAGYHTPTLLAGPGAQSGARVVWTAGGYSILAEQLDGTQVWWKPFMSGWRPGAVADVDGDGRLEIGAPTWGQVFTWPPPMDPAPGLGRALACLDMETGEVRWTYDPGASMSGVVSADVDGDGLPEFVFGTGDGRLIALRGGDSQNRLVFSVQLPAALGTPILCDPNGSGRMHILVGCADGKLYALS